MHILSTSPLSDICFICFTNIFSHIMTYLFIILGAFFSEVYLFYSFIGGTLGSPRFPPMVFEKVYNFAFYFYVYNLFWANFCEKCKVYVHIFCVCVCAFSSKICQKDYNFSIEFSLLLYQTSVNCISKSISWLSSVSHWSMCLLFHQYHIVLIIIAL